MHSTSTSYQNPHMSHAVDNADWLKTVAIISVSVSSVIPVASRPDAPIAVSA